MGHGWPPKVEGRPEAETEGGVTQAGWKPQGNADQMSRERVSTEQPIRCWLWGVRVLPLSSSPPSLLPPQESPFPPSFLPACLGDRLLRPSGGGGKSLIPKILALQAAVWQEWAPHPIPSPFYGEAPSSSLERKQQWALRPLSVSLTSLQPTPPGVWGWGCSESGRPVWGPREGAPGVTRHLGRKGMGRGISR